VAARESRQARKGAAVSGLLSGVPGNPASGHPFEDAAHELRKKDARPFSQLIFQG